MGATPKYALPYPELDDPDNVPTDMHELATAIEAIPSLGYWTLAAGVLSTPSNVQVPNLTATGAIAAASVTASGTVTGGTVNATGNVNAAGGVGVGVSVTANGYVVANADDAALRIQLHTDGLAYFGAATTFGLAGAGVLRSSGELVATGAVRASGGMSMGTVVNGPGIAFPHAELVSHAPNHLWIGGALETTDDVNANMGGAKQIGLGKLDMGGGNFVGALVMGGGDTTIVRTGAGALWVAGSTADAPARIDLGHYQGHTIDYMGQLAGSPGVAGGRVMTYACWGWGLDPVNGAIYGLDVNGNVHALGFPVSSDERLKTALAPLDGAVAKLAQIRTVQFEWNPAHATQRDYPEGTYLGVIAQDVQAVYPELVTEWIVSKPPAERTLEDGTLVPDELTDETRLAVDYGRLTAPIIAAIGELDARLAALEAGAPA